MTCSPEQVSEPWPAPLVVVLAWLALQVLELGQVLAAELTAEPMA